MLHNEKNKSRKHAVAVPLERDVALIRKRERIIFYCIRNHSSSPYTNFNARTFLYWGHLVRTIARRLSL
jgi:hypothetical protein